ncbi:MAG: hypothetical protein KatS3mg031_1248 [Chitinophagales bacterium]|nr:MAG: hypothetical protein KatS3mg031_1248 [Chitinophagales bacterium]
MKNQCFFTLVAMLIALNQPTYSQWNLNGNTTTGQYIGTNNFQPFPIHTQGIERMRVDANGNVGINTPTPQAKLEINAVQGSMLRFTQLRSGSYVFTDPNPGPGVLSVDEEGDVIYVPGGDVKAWSGPTNANHLTKWYTNNKVIGNSIITDDGNRIGVNTNPQNNVLVAVNNQTQRIGLSSLTACVGCTGSFTLSGNIAVHGEARNNNGQTNVGGAFFGRLAQSSTGYDNVGIFSMGGDLAALHFGYSIAIEHIDASDITLKDSIENVTNVLALLSQLQPKSYVYKRDSFPFLPSGRKYGFIAQQVDTVAPELTVSFGVPEIRDTAGNAIVNDMDLLGLSYNGLLPLLVAGVNELNNGKVSSCATPTDSNYVTKWDAVNNVLCNSLIYDNGNNVGIGATDTLEGARLVVRAGTNQAGIFGYADSDTFSQAGVVGVSIHAGIANIGVLGSAGGAELPGPEDEQMNAGVAGFAHLPSAGKNIGVIAVSKGSSAFNAAVFALSEDEDTDTAIHAGVIAFASGSDSVNVGGLFGAEYESGINIGLFALAGGSDSSTAGYFAGDVTVTGAVYETSDQRLKTNIADMDRWESLNVIRSLKPRSYAFKTEDFRTMSLPGGIQHGLIAQEVEQLLPELVTTRVQPEMRGLQGKMLSERAEFKAVNYTGLIPYLISAMQAQQATIEEQQARIDSLSAAIRGTLTNLENTINQCCGVGYRQSNPEEQTGEEEDNANHLTVELSSLQVVILEQNVPNPFKEQTSISYFIPEETGKAQMLFFDITGRIIKTVELQKGYGIMTVFAQNLSSGTYSYSLVIDGEVVETKRMVKR